MATDGLTTAHLNYLQRSDFDASSLSAAMASTYAPAELRRLWRIDGVGRVEKSPLPLPGQPVWIPSNDVLVGLYGYKIPIAFLIWGEPGGVAIHIGTWSPAQRENASAAVLDSRQDMLRTVLNSLYTAVELQPTDAELARSPLAGLVLGIPTAKSPDMLDGALPLDRLIRAMTGQNWACLVLAEPVDENAINNMRLNIMNETRAVQAAAKAEMAPSPLAKHYGELLEAALMTLTQGQATGAWRTAVYLLGDSTSFYHLSGTWHGVFAGEKSLPEPIRVWDNPATAEMAVEWAMPDAPGPASPGLFQHPFQFQTLLNSSQLAAYIHLPQLETSGFSILAVPDFDTVPQSHASERTLRLGNVMQGSQKMEVEYSITPKSLNRHTFIAGVTGAGKTNTIFYLLKQCVAEGVPFLVIEPAKAEYRALQNDPLVGDKLRVFTLGNEMVSPLRLNPFEVLPGTTVGVHLDLLRSVFTASFGMWTPLPQILEQCLHAIYVDRGWDITSNTNYRIDESTNPGDAFPILSDLLAKVDEVTEELGYGDRVTADMRGALRTRINSLRTGGKGRMLDVRRSLPMEVLLGHPTILELEGMGDDDDKAFMMGLLLIRLAEHLRAGGEVDGLQHLLVIEEAHRLLTNVGQRGAEEEANPRGKAVETFANLLSEIRAYGEGVLVADQVPLKLAPDVIKNTNLKIAHRIVAKDDREVLAGAMAMNDRQAHALATLRLGEAAVFAEGDDAPLLVKVPKAKGGDRSTVSDESLAQAWLEFRDREGLHPLFLSYPTCDIHCAPPNIQCSDARRIAELPAVERSFATFLLSLALGSLTCDEEGFPDLLAEVYLALHDVLNAQLSAAGTSANELRCALSHALHNYLEKRGSQYGWSYAQVTETMELMLPALLKTALGQELDSESVEALIGFCQAYNLLCQGEGPFYGCEQTCGSTCCFRYDVEAMMEDTDLRSEFRDAASDFDNVRSLGKYVADQILLPAVEEPYHSRAALCFIIQQIHAWAEYGWENQRLFVEEIIIYHQDQE